MTFGQYRILTEEERYTVWAEQAIAIARYENSFYSYELYRLYDFYVEIRTNKIFSNIEQWKIFTNEEYLEPYLKSIDISSLA